MTGYVDNIEEITEKNSSFRKVVYTGNHLQLVVMSLKPGEDIGEEVHPKVDQFFRVEQGEAKVIIDGKEDILKEDMVVIVPAGAQHNLINNSDIDLKLYTIYSPANHPDGTIHKDKAEADKYEEEHHH